MRPVIFALCLGIITGLTTASAASGPAIKSPGAHRPTALKSAATKPKTFSAANPSDIITLFANLGATAVQTKSDEGMVFLDVTAPGTSFGVQMIDCAPTGMACHAMALFSVFDKPGITLAQLNDFNRSQFACRGLSTPDNHPSVMYATLLDNRMTQDQVKAHFRVWQGCLKGFGDFVADPVEFCLSRMGRNNSANILCERGIPGTPISDLGDLPGGPP
ncbi:MAG: hypothetical protein CGW95_06045 [Phenylobacterium zucineum]|nr:MAG: hypothetical protein CGW95_06045 [Phenylobacterium zucineum]